MKMPSKAVLITSIELLLIGNVVLFYFGIPAQLIDQGPERGMLTLAFLDVGQGDALFIQTPFGRQVLIDGGPESTVTQSLSEQMPWMDKSLDLIIATHADADHIGGLPQVLMDYKIDTTLQPVTEATTAVYAAWNILKREEGSINLIAYAGQEFILDASTTLEILAPAKGEVGKGNDSSIVAVIRYGKTCAVLTGDADVERESQILLSDYSRDKIDCEILKVGHHGSDTSTSEQFLLAVSPEYSIISSGKNNTYGHPKASILNRLQSSGTQILRTDREGSIVFESDGSNWVRD